MRAQAGIQALLREGPEKFFEERRDVALAPLLMFLAA